MIPKQVYRVLQSVSLTICPLDPSPSWMIKVTDNFTDVCIHVVISASLSQEMVPLALKEAVVGHFLKRSLLHGFRQLIHSLGKVAEKLVELHLQRSLYYLDNVRSGFSLCIDLAHQ